MWPSRSIGLELMKTCHFPSRSFFTFSLRPLIMIGVARYSRPKYHQPLTYVTRSMSMTRYNRLKVKWQFDMIWHNILEDCSLWQALLMTVHHGSYRHGSYRYFEIISNLLKTTRITWYPIHVIKLKHRVWAECGLHGWKHSSQQKWIWTSTLYGGGVVKVIDLSVLLALVNI